MKRTTKAARPPKPELIRPWASPEGYLACMLIILGLGCGSDSRVNTIDAHEETAHGSTRPETNDSSSIETVGSIERLDPKLVDLIAEDAVLEVLARGFDWSEGPVWVPGLGRSQTGSPDGFLLFSDVPQNVIHRWSASEGTSVWLKPSGYTGTSPRGAELGSNGLFLDSARKLLIAQHGDRRIARLHAKPSLQLPSAASQSSQLFETIAESYEGKQFSSPNDLVVGDDGTLWFTDPPYGLEHGPEDPAREIAYQGVYEVSPKGAVTLVTNRLSRPNGVALSPDGDWLYITNSDPERAVWWRIPRQAGGSFRVGEGDESPVWFDATNLVADRPGLPDGLDVDRDGNVWSTGPGGVLVLSAQGEHLGTLLTERPTGNCTFGEDGRSLFITADDVLLRIRTKAIGARFPNAE